MEKHLMRTRVPGFTVRCTCRTHVKPRLSRVYVHAAEGNTGEGEDSRARSLPQAFPTVGFERLHRPDILSVSPVQPIRARERMRGIRGRRRRDGGEGSTPLRRRGLVAREGSMRTRNDGTFYVEESTERSLKEQEEKEQWK